MDGMEELSKLDQEQGLYETGSGMSGLLVMRGKVNELLSEIEPLIKSNPEYLHCLLTVKDDLESADSMLTYCIEE